MTESKESYLLPVIPKDEKPVFPEFDENKPLLHNEEKVKKYVSFLLNFIGAY